jgi:hypothetical protein
MIMNAYERMTARLAGKAVDRLIEYYQAQKTE